MYENAMWAMINWKTIKLLYLLSLVYVPTRSSFLPFINNAGVATAFAARDILGNVLSGLSVQLSQPFSVGDTIKVCQKFS